MAVKYYIRYFDIIGVEHRLDIFDDTYEDEAIQVDGNVTLTYSDTDDSLEAIRGQGLRVELEANTDLTFNSLWSEDEKTYKVEYYRDFELIFNGWLNPEGFFENWVDTNWIITFDCVDGLGYLSDLSFVDENGFPITGKKSYIEILYLALKRTGFEQEINTSIGIEYTGMDSTKGVLTQVYANTERYVKDDGETIMSCEEVIRDILEPFGAVLTSLKGQWYIYKPNELFKSSTVTFKGYRYFENIGIIKNAVDKIVDTNINLGNDGVRSLFHCNANQSIRNVSSIGAYRIKYKYGLVQSLLGNSNLTSYDGITIDDWDILDASKLVTPLVIDSAGVRIITTAPNYVSVLRTSPIIIGESSQAIIVLNFTIPFKSGTKILPYQIFITDKPITDSSAKYYYMQSDSTWGSENDVNDLLFTDGNTTNGITYNIERRTLNKPDAISGSGYLYVLIKSPITSNIDIEAFCDINSVQILPAQEDDNIIGEIHTFQRETKPSAKIQENKEVATGDNVSDIYEGTIYKRDTVTPTETWNRKDIVEEKYLLQIMGEETLRLNAKPSRVFTGDVYGYFNYLSVITIDNLDGVYMPIKYSYDTKNNIISGEFKQIYGEELDDIKYSGRVPDYGNTVKPTII